MKTRVISTEIWDEDKVFALNIDTKLLYLVLLTNPYIGQTRFYKINDRQLSTFTGLNVEQIQKCKKDLTESEMVYFKDGWVCVTGYGFIECFYKGEKNEIARAKEEGSIPLEIFSFFNQKLQDLGVYEKENRKNLIMESKKYGRKKMTNTRRERLFNLLGRVCNDCSTSDALFELDHIKALSLGGLDVDENIQVLCESCHRKKTTLDLKDKSSDTLYEISDTTINQESGIINTKSRTKNQESETKRVDFVAEIIKEMESIDPKNKIYYGNKTQRAACQFLIENYGFEKVKEMIQILPELKNKVAYLPSITTPCELRDKWQKVGDAITRESTIGRNKLKENINNIIY
jgi:hypothetical protein